MRKLIGMVAVPLTLAVTPAMAAELLVRVTGAASGVGEIGCAVHTEGSDFPAANEKVKNVWVKADSKGVTCRFKGLQPGTYAVAVSHDLNGSRSLDTNFLGIPKEDWAVSNNVRPTMRAPRFEEAAFAVGNGVTTIDVRLGR